MIRDVFMPLVAAVCVAACAHANGAPMMSSEPRTAVSHTPFANAIDALFAPYDHPDSPGASIVVIQRDTVVFMRGYGSANLELHTPADAQTDYRLASLTKQFTATAIMLLVQDGRLSYDERVSDVLSGLPAYAHDVRIRNLLNHTSGLWDYEDLVPDTQRVQVHDRDMFALLARADSLYFPPGTHFRYSNTGYALLALVVEKTSGMSFAHFLHDRIFAPLEMTSTLAYEKGVSTVPHRAYGYTQRDSVFQPTDQSPTSAVLGDGGVYSSVADLVKWDHALETNAIVSAASQQLAWTPPVLPAGAPTKYGFGWFVDHDGGRRRLYHHGETSGFTNFILRYPEQRLTVIVLTNRNGGEPWTIGQKVADMFLGTVSAVPQF